MYKKQSLLYSLPNKMLCKYNKNNTMCGKCTYKLTDSNLLVSLGTEHLIKLLASLIRCTDTRNIAINPESIIIACNGFILYDTMIINSDYKYSTNAELCKCIIHMWMAVSPFHEEPYIKTIIENLTIFIDSSTGYSDLSATMMCIVNNYSTWCNDVLNSNIIIMTNSHAASSHY